jgi:Tol biopolymer transport system component
VVERDHAAERPPPLATSVAGVAWSPDGTQLAVITSKPGGAELLVIDVASGATDALTRDEVSFSGGVVWLDDRRVAYQRDDNRTYRWIDRVDRTTGTVVDPAPGWTFDLRPSPVDHTLALYWNRKDPGLWLVPPDGEPTRLRETTWTEVHAWSADGQLWTSEDGRIDRYDPRSGETTHVRTLDLEPATQIVGLFPLDGDRVLLELFHVTADLVLYAPER